MERRLESMGQNDKIQLFEDKRIRTAWDEEKEEWFFSVGGEIHQHQSQILDCIFVHLFVLHG